MTDSYDQEVSQAAYQGQMSISAVILFHGYHEDTASLLLCRYSLIQLAWPSWKNLLSVLMVNPTSTCVLLLSSRVYLCTNVLSIHAWAGE